MPKKVGDLPNKGHTGVNKLTDLVHIHTAGREVGGQTDFKIPFLDLFDYGEEIAAAYLYKTNTHSMSANVWTEIAWTTTLFDTHNFVNPDNSGFIVPMDGFYLIYAAMGYDAISNWGYQQGRILLDGGSFPGSHSITDGLAGWLRQQQQHVYAYLGAGTEVTYSMYFQSTVPPLTRAGQDENQFSIYRIAGA